MRESEAPDSVVEFDDVSRLFGETVALDSVSFSVRQGEFFSIIGPSGSGKTTTVRMIAGLETPTGGTVRLFGRDVTAVPPHQRGTPMVFQSYALFPHLDIRDNVAYGLRMRRVAKLERRNRADDLLALVGLEGLGGRRPEQLSGGQQQRVALARAIATEPRVDHIEYALEHEPNGVVNITMHPQVTGRVHVLRMVERVLQKIADRPGLHFRTMSEAVRLAKENHLVETFC